MRYLSLHISAIIKTYDGSLPLAHYLKNYFRQHPKLGSRDRKMLTTLAYSWYRSCKGIERDEWLDILLSFWAANPGQFKSFSLLSWLSENAIPVYFDRLFPFNISLSGGIAREEWLQSMLRQPRLFIRVRHNREKIIAQLSAAGIPCSIITDSCLSLPNTSKIEDILDADSYVVQDASSQKTGEYFRPASGEHWYDCCSGAGGKSLLLKDIQPQIALTVSDKRESIISNLVRRFKSYNYPAPATRIVDVADKIKLASALGNAKFDNILCDAPCSGSGTWARTPEQMYFFDPSALGRFAALQKIIALNAAQHLRPGGRLIYITCSVFAAENEEVAKEVSRKSGLMIREQHLINGISIQADSMFVAVLENNNG